MSTMHRARPGAKSDPARRFGWGTAQAIKALTGRVPTPAQLATLGEAALSLRSTAAARCPMRPDPAPHHRALTFNRAGRLVADAALVPRRTVRIPGPCNTFEVMETHRDKLTRCAAIMLSGCAAESYATGSVIHHQPATLIAAFSAMVLGDGDEDNLKSAELGFEWCASSALLHTWHDVEAVEARLNAGQSADDILIQVAQARATRANLAWPARSPVRAALDCHLHHVGDSVIEVALTLHRAGVRK